MFDFFKRKQISSGAPNPFASWPPPEAVLSSEKHPSLFEQNLVLFESMPIQKVRHDPQGFPPLVIALGKTGEIVLRQWHQQVLQSSEHGMLGAGVLIHAEPQPITFAEEGLPLRAFNLQLVGERTTFDIDRRSPRTYVRSLFAQAINYESLKNHLLKCINDLKPNIRIFIIGSLTEPSIGVLGSLLQLLALFQKNEDRPFHSVNGFLTFDAPQEIEQLEKEEKYAALREISRFTLRGNHIMPRAAFNETRFIYDTNLIDHLFLLDAEFPPSVKATQKGFEDVSGRSMSEALFTLTHSASQMIWEHLSNELTSAANARGLTQDAVVHGLGVASLYLPFSQIESYAATRLAKAVLFGEADTSGEGLVKGASSLEEGDSLAQRWLKSAPFEHPLFPWLLSLQNSSQLRYVPPTDSGYLKIFRQKLATHLTEYLNQPDGGSLFVAREGLRWLTSHTEKIQGMLKTLPVEKNSTTEFQNFGKFLAQLHTCLSYLEKQTTEWIKTSSPEFLQTLVPADEPIKPDGLFENLWREFGTQPNVRGSTSASRHSLIEQSLREPDKQIIWKTTLEKYMVEAIEEVDSSAHNSFLRSVLGRENASQELSALYRNYFRPELSQPGKNIESPIFAPLRQRVGWWVMMSPEKEQPEILAICLPPHWKPDTSTSISLKATYSVQAANKFFEAVYHNCLLQARSVRKNLVAEFSQRALFNKETLSIAHSSFLQYDHNGIARIKGEHPNNPDSERLAVRRGYILASDPDTARQYISLFRNLSPGNVNFIGEMDNTRLTALEITTNIPLQTISLHKGAYESYRYKEIAHLYSQEQNAKIYERKIRQIDSSAFKNTLFSPQTTLLLGSQPLIRLFFHLLFADLLIQSSRQEGVKTIKVWQVSSFDKYPALELGKAPDLASLVEAFRSFVLSIPYQSHDRGHPFHVERRMAYLTGLSKRVRQIEQDEATQKARMDKADTYLLPLIRVGEHNVHIEEFAILMRIEREFIFEVIPDDIDWEKELWL